MNTAEKDIWNQVMALKDKDDSKDGIKHNFNTQQIETICTVIYEMGGNPSQAWFDLGICKYRIYDWLGMCIMGNRIESIDAVKLLTHSFLKTNGDPKKWFDDLINYDYYRDNSWKALAIVGE